MRVVICWTDITGYMVSCCRELAKRPGIELFVVAYAPHAAAHQSFRTELLAGLEHRLLEPHEQADPAVVQSVVLPRKPDAVMLAGWANQAFRGLAFHPDLAAARFVMTMDNPWKGTWRQRLARWKVGRFVNRMDALFVAGERSWQFARRLGAPERKIYRGTYGFDLPLFKEVLEQRLAAGPWPRRFLFMGRYVDLKGFDVLLPAYRKYRGSVSDPWPFAFVGQGPNADAIRAEPGCEDWGFKHPAEQPDVLARCGVFVLVSWYEAWSVALAEAMASGLPAICSEEVGATVDLIRACYTGLTVATRDADALADALRWMHEHYDRLPRMGRAAREFAAAHSAELWAERVHRMLDTIARPSR